MIGPNVVRGDLLHTCLSRAAGPRDGISSIHRLLKRKNVPAKANLSKRNAPLIANLQPG
jgi:hypothetical protein